MTPDTWHLTCDTWWGVNILLKLQLSSSYGLGIMMFWGSGGKGSVNESVSNGGVCRTSPATPGLLIIYCRWPSVKYAGLMKIGLCLTSQWGTTSPSGKDRSFKTPSACRSRSLKGGEERVSNLWNFQAAMHVCWTAATSGIWEGLLAWLACTFLLSCHK